MYHVARHPGVGRPKFESPLSLWSILLNLFEACCLVGKLWLTLVTPWTVAHQAPSVHGISQTRILEWIAISFPGEFPDPGIKPTSSALAGRFLTIEPQGSPLKLNFPLSVNPPT